MIFSAGLFFLVGGGVGGGGVGGPLNIGLLSNFHAFRGKKVKFLSSNTSLKLRFLCLESVLM